MDYALIFTEDLTEQITSTHPHLNWNEGGSIEVKEYMKYHKNKRPMSMTLA